MRNCYKPIEIIVRDEIQVYHVKEYQFDNYDKINIAK